MAATWTAAVEGATTRWSGSIAGLDAAAARCARHPQLWRAASDLSLLSLSARRSLARCQALRGGSPPAIEVEVRGALGRLPAYTLVPPRDLAGAIAAAIEGSALAALVEGRDPAGPLPGPQGDAPLPGGDRPRHRRAGAAGRPAGPAAPAALRCAARPPLSQRLHRRPVRGPQRPALRGLAGPLPRARRQPRHLRLRRVPGGRRRPRRGGGGDAPRGRGRSPRCWSAPSAAPRCCRPSTTSWLPTWSARPARPASPSRRGCHTCTAVGWRAGRRRGSGDEEGLDRVPAPGSAAVVSAQPSARRARSRPRDTNGSRLSGLATALSATAWETSPPISRRLTGTSSFLPERVRGRAGTETTRSGT